MFGRPDYHFIKKYGDLTHEGVAVFDLNTRKFVYFNGFFLRIFGVEESELLANPELLIQFVVPEDRDFMDRRYRELLSIGCISTTEFRIQLNSGDVRYLSTEVLWVEENYTFAIFLRDITLIQQHDASVIKFMAQKDALLDMLIHNLSGPLYLSRDVLRKLSLESQGTDTETVRLISLMQNNTEGCLDIINNFLEKEHLESMKTIVKHSRFDVAGKVETVLLLLREMNPEKKFDVRTENVQLYSDPVKFCQILHNVVSNAVKFTPDDGNIQITVTGTEKTCDILVTDNGVGVPPVLKPRLFREHVEGTPGLRGERSNGMGLFIVKNLMDMMGGTVSLESDAEGTRVQLSFPFE